MNCLQMEKNIRNSKKIKISIKYKLNNIAVEKNGIRKENKKYTKYKKIVSIVIKKLKEVKKRDTKGCV